MGTTYSPSVVTNGLVMYYDMSNTQKSWRGAPVANLLPNPAINSVPTTGNGWGTYNTNQYNGAAYFSIGSIASVSSNIVTTAGTHPLRSYDVVTPQTSGGGVTAGVNYLVKKQSATQFSLHAYNSSQDGSQGFINPATNTHKVYDDFANEVRISINSSSFPTMWWGPPHLPNSGLVKEVRINGCSIPGIPTTDCLRLYHTRSDGVTDGMAYGPDANVTAGVAHTVSFWTKAVNPAAVGQYIGYQIYNYGATTPTGYSFNAVFGPVGVWTKHSMTFTPNNPLAISYFFPSSGNIIYDLAHIQVETGSVANAWTNSSRSTTQSLLDLTGRNTFTVNSLTYSSNNNNTFSFNGSSDYISLPNTQIIGASAGTVSAIINIPSAQSDYDTIFTCETGPDWNNLRTWMSMYGANQIRFTVSNTVSSTQNGCVSSVLAYNTIYHVTGTYDGSNVKIYLNGVLNASLSSSIVPGTFTPTMVRIGHHYDTRYFGGSIYVFSTYNRSLTANEVAQNFNAIRGRYGI